MIDWINSLKKIAHPRCWLDDPAVRKYRLLERKTKVAHMVQTHHIHVPENQIVFSYHDSNEEEVKHVDDTKLFS